jgi:TolB protein
VNKRTLLPLVISVFFGGSLPALSQDTTIPTGLIVLNSILDDQEIEVMTIGTGAAHNITQSAGVDIANSISNDGTTILFSSNRGGDFQLYTMDLDGSNIIQLTDSAGGNNLGAFSPANTKIAFISRRNGVANIFIMDPDGANPIQLTDSEIRATSPYWSPNGEQIAFFQFLNAERDEQFGFNTLEVNIGVVPVTGGDFRILAENVSIRYYNQINTYLEWSPDSTSILYRSVADDQDTELLLVNIETGETSQLTANEDEESGFTWTDDGRVVFSSFGGYRLYSETDDRQAHIYIMDADGVNIQNITSQSNVLNPIQNLVFISETNQVMFDLWTPGSDDNRIDLWVVDLDGENLFNITNTPTVTEGGYLYVPTSEGNLP